MVCIYYLHGSLSHMLVILLSFSFSESSTKSQISVEKAQFCSNQSIENVLAGLLEGRYARLVFEYTGPASELELGIQQLSFALQTEQSVQRGSLGSSLGVFTWETSELYPQRF